MRTYGRGYDRQEGASSSELQDPPDFSAVEEVEQDCPVGAIDNVLVGLYDSFLQERFSGTWTTTRDEMRGWIVGKGKAPAPLALA